MDVQSARLSGTRRSRGGVYDRFWRAGGGAEAVHGAEGSAGGDGRFGYRVVRLLHLPHGGGPGLRPAVLPWRQRGCSGPGLVQHGRCWLRRASGRRNTIRLLWGQIGSQADPGHSVADHGHSDHSGRSAADVRHHRCRRPHNPLRVALLSGPRRRRPVGRAVLLATEYAPEGKRGFYGSFAQVGVPVGLVLGNSIFLILMAIMGEAAFAAWGWRIPFLLSVVLIGVALYIQLRLEETPAFRQLEERQHEGEESESRSPVLEVLRDNPKQVLLAGGAFFVVNGAYYVMITGMLDYGTRVLGVSQNIMLAAVLISSFAQIFLLTRWSALSDRLGRRPVYLAGAALLGLWAFPMFWLVNIKTAFLITLALFIGQMFLSMMYGPQAALFSEMFSARVRYSGASIGYQGASVFAGGLAPIIMVWLLETTGMSLSVSLYVFAMAVVTFVSVYLITETYGDEMTRDQVREIEEEAATTG